MKILTIVGARPQFIKAAVLSRIFASNPKVEEYILHTGQHYDQNMSDVFFKELRIPKPNFLLESGGKTHGAMTGYQIIEIERIIVDLKPDLVLVYGDTNSTLAGALAAVKLRVPIAHVEAGLRSFNNNMPEEINRKLTDQMSDLLFCPTLLAKKNLINEGIDEGKIFVVGDIMYDAVKFYSKENLITLDSFGLNLEPKGYYLLTLHREEITTNHIILNEVLHAVSLIKEKVVFPIHPRARKVIEESKVNLPENLLTIDPIGYFKMLTLQKNSIKILTDSGGVQKEAYFNKVPCITLRKETEWMELVEEGVNVLVDFNGLKIAEEVLKDSKEIIFPMGIYGEGNTGIKIADVLIK